MSQAPAGWYTDPSGRHEYRYWDGSEWTAHVSDAGVTGADPLRPTPPDGEASTAVASSATTATADDADDISARLRAGIARRRASDPNAFRGETEEALVAQYDQLTQRIETSKEKDLGGSFIGPLAVRSGLLERAGLHTESMRDRLRLMMIESGLRTSGLSGGWIAASTISVGLDLAGTFLASYSIAKRQELAKQAARLQEQGECVILGWCPRCGQVVALDSRLRDPAQHKKVEDLTFVVPEDAGLATSKLAELHAR